MFAVGCIHADCNRTGHIYLVVRCEGSRMHDGYLISSAAARFMPDSADDGLPVPVFWNKPTASKPSSTYDLPLYHKPC